MSEYRRWRVAGSMVFVTIVTYGRRPFLTTPVARRLLREAIEATRTEHPFDLFASVLLPDHWHLVVELPDGSDNYARRIGRIKELFTRGRGVTS